MTKNMFEVKKNHFDWITNIWNITSKYLKHDILIFWFISSHWLICLAPNHILNFFFWKCLLRELALLAIYYLSDYLYCHKVLPYEIGDLSILQFPPSSTIIANRKSPLLLFIIYSSNASLTEHNGYQKIKETSNPHRNL